MKKIAVTAFLLLVSPQLVSAETPTLPPRVSKEHYVLYVASAMAAVRYCERLELNSQYIVGFGDATGLIAPFAEPGYRESYQREFERREKEAREDPQNYCKLAIAMFHRDVKPRAVLAPLLMNKSSPVNYSHHVDSFV